MNCGLWRGRQCAVPPSVCALWSFGWLGLFQEFSRESRISTSGIYSLVARFWFGPLLPDLALAPIGSLAVIHNTKYLLRDSDAVVFFFCEMLYSELKINVYIICVAKF